MSFRGATASFLSVFVLILAVTIIGRATPTFANTIMFEDGFESCDYQKYSDVAQNKIDRTTRHSGNCSSRIGGDGAGWGKLVVKLPSRQTELWFRAYVFFPPEFELPGGGEGIHLWRFLSSPYAQGVFQLDFNVPFKGNAIQLFHHPGNSGGESVAKWTNFKPADDGRRGQWQCWEVHSRLNQAGQSDGLVEFYEDGIFVDSISGNFRGSSTDGYLYVDVQSNIGSTNPALWPRQNWWYVDDVVVSTERVGCLPDAADKTPPNAPSGVRIETQ